jgi:hypothetical protein
MTMPEFDFTFERRFRHEDWVDNQSRVQAGGPEGFNQRFHALEADLDAVGAVVNEIRAAMNALVAAPPAQELNATFTPALVPTSGAGWTHSSGQANKSGPSSQGMMSVSLPHGARLRRFRVIGRNGGSGNLRIELNRQAVRAETAEASQTETVARVTGSEDPFDRVEVVPAQLDLVETDRFKYFIEAKLDNSTSGAVALMAFQITYVAG